MIEIHQAIYGEGRDQGHSLLRSSYSNDTLPNQLSGYTDLVDRPHNGVLSGPILRGFMIKESFLLVKSFPDLTGRVGRVFSHAIIIKKEDFLKVKDVADLLQFHLPEIDKYYDTQLIRYENDPQVGDKNLSPRMLIATDALINHVEYNNTVVWVGETDYWQWISRIWPRIPDPVKIGIKLGNAFNARNLDKENLNLLTIPEAVLPSWLKEGCAFIQNQQIEKLDDVLVNYMVGKDTDSKLAHLLKEIKPIISEIDDLRLLNKYADLYGDINNTSSFRDLIILTDLVSRYNRDTGSAIDQKKNIIDALARSTSSATAMELFSLQHQTWVGYDMAYVATKMEVALNKWLNENLFTAQNLSEKSKIVGTAITSRKQTLLHLAVVNYIKTAFKSWRLSYKETVWKWILDDMKAAESLLLLLPDEAQDHMVNSMPVLPKDVAEIVMSTATKKGWINLLGMTAVKILSSRKAFERVLTIKLTYAQESVLDKMATKISPLEFMVTASNIDDERLRKVAVNILKSKPSLKQELDFSMVGWQAIWGQSAKEGLHIWEGIKQPKEYLHYMMDLVVAGNDYNKILLNEVGKSGHCSVKEYEARNVAWSTLPSDCRQYFLISTIKECLLEVSNNNTDLTELEGPLQDSMNLPEVIAFITSSDQISFEMKIKFLSNIRSFNEDHAIALIKENRFSKEESRKFGNLVSTKRWGRVAKYIFDNIDNRSDLQPALRNCSKQLGFWDKLQLTAFGYESKIISQDEFWNMLYTKSTELYPDGPNQYGLWERAGGDRSDLHTNGSAKTIWQFAITHMKRNGSPRKENLLKQMIVDFAHDKSLKQLKEII